MNITVATLIYKSTAYLDFVLTSLLTHQQSEHNVKFLVVCNDATDEVIESAIEWEERAGVKCVVHKNPDPNEWWINRVYRAWNRCLEECDTEYICFVNSDMAFTPGWLDALAVHDLDRYIPTSRLVESERMPSIRGLIPKNFGQTIGTFDANKFQDFAETVREEGYSVRTGAYMPSLFRCSTLRSIGGWHKNVGNMPGDRITFSILQRRYGIEHIMVHDSIVYHFIRGESAETGDL